MLRRVLLPDSDLQVSELCLGAGPFGTRVRGSDVDRVLSRFLEAGGTFLDTAHCYACWVPGGVGASERELGAALRRVGAGDRVVVATKGGHPTFGAEYPRPDRFLAPDLLQRDVSESLERLGRDFVPLYYLHRDDGVTPVDEIIDALNELVDAGLVGYLGASNWSLERIAAANAYARANALQGFVVSQIQGSLAVPKWRPTTDPTTRLLGREEAIWHRDSRIPVVCYSATASGYFAGRGVEQGGYATAENARRAARAEELAELLRATPTQIAIAWLQALPAVVIPLFSTGSVEHLEEVLGACRLRLEDEEVAMLRDPLAPIEPAPGPKASPSEPASRRGP